MWLCADHGFTSTVLKHPDDTHLTMRAREVETLQAVCTILELAPEGIHTAFPSDYPYRVLLAPEEFERYVVHVAHSVTYDNFKDHVADVRGKHSKYLDFLGEVWVAGLSMTPWSVRKENDAEWDRVYPITYGKGSKWGDKPAAGAEDDFMTDEEWEAIFRID